MQMRYSQTSRGGAETVLTLDKKMKEKEARQRGTKHLKLTIHGVGHHFSKNIGEGNPGNVLPWESNCREGHWNLQERKSKGGEQQ